MYCLVTASADYPENFALRLLQDFMQEVGFAHGALLKRAEPYSLNLPTQPYMKELLQRFEDPEKLSHEEIKQEVQEEFDKMAKISDNPAFLASKKAQTLPDKYSVAVDQLRLGEAADAAHGLRQLLGVDDQQIAKFFADP